MAFAIACLGEKLRKISSKAHLTIADLSAYLNEVYIWSVDPDFLHLWVLLYQIRNA